MINFLKIAQTLFYSNNLDLIIELDQRNENSISK
jgi:hypothetical protein